MYVDTPYISLSEILGYLNIRWGYLNKVNKILWVQFFNYKAIFHAQYKINTIKLIRNLI